jgi:hypothetical protein
LLAIASGGKLNVAWPGVDCEKKLKEYKILVKVDENNWNVTLKDIQQPIVKVKAEIDISILECIGLNKIHMTYHGNESEDKVDEVQDSSHADDARGDADASNTNSDKSGSPQKRS